MKKLIRPLPRQHTFNLFTAEEVLAEVMTVAEALRSIGITCTGPLPDIDNERWGNFIWTLTQCFGPLPPDTESVLHAVEGQFEPDLLTGLAGRCLQGIEGLGRATEGAGPTDPAWLLLPATYAQRVDMLLGEGRMPLVSVRQIDLLQFWPGTDNG